MFKSYQDSTWSQIYDRYYTMGDIIKNLCEDNANYFKRYLARFIPKVKYDPDYNKNSRNIVFDSYVRMESFISSNLMWHLKTGSLNYPDMPEMAPCTLRIFEIVTEYVNGPCPENQRILYLYRTDVWVGIIMREIDDVNSMFYSVKDRCIDFIFGLIEGEGSFPLSEKLKEKNPNPYLTSSFMSSNITPSKIIQLMYKLTKRLALHRKMQNSSSFKSSILKKVNRNREKFQKILKKEGIRTEQEIVENVIKMRAKDRLFSVYDNQDSIVTNEMLEATQFDDYRELIELYKKDTEFSQHILISIVLKLYSLIMNLSN